MRSRKKSSGALKYFVLIIIVIILVVSFKLTLKGREVKENPNEDNKTPNTSQQEQEPQSTPNEPTSQTEPNPQNRPEENELSGGKEVLPLNQYRFYDTYVIASEETKYYTSGYKYFIVGTYDTFLTYLNTNMQSTLGEDDEANYADINATTLAGVKNIFTKDFFKTKYMLFVVDYSSNQISGTIDNIESNEGEITVTIKRDLSAKDTSKFNTYLVPLETKEVDSVKIEYTK